MEKIETLSDEKLVAHGLGLGRFLPHAHYTRMGVCIAFPFFFFFSHLWLTLVAQPSYAFLVPPVLITGTCFILQFRKWGMFTNLLLLGIAVVAFPQQILSSWQQLHLVSLIFALLTAYLCFEEIRNTVQVVSKEQKEKVLQFHALMEQQQKSYQALQEQTHTLSKELEDWKTEAKQRKIDSQMLYEKLTLIEREVRDYESQKQSLINSSFEARKQYFAQFVEEGIEISPESQTEISKWKGMYHQLRDQFEEKTAVLVKTRRELFHVKGELEALKIELNEEEFIQNEEIHAAYARLMKELEYSQIECEQEITHLEALISRSHHQ